jgi:transposase
MTKAEGVARAKRPNASAKVQAIEAKVTMRNSYGFRTFRVLELALYHSLAKLPEPELTPEFF